MERMTDYKPQERQDLEELYRKQNVRINELEQENKRLKIEIGGLMGERDGKQMRIDELKEENRKLKEKVRFLEECLDNKEKVNKSLREELSAYDREYFDEDKKAKNIFIDNSGKVIKGGEFTTLC